MDDKRNQINGRKCLAFALCETAIIAIGYGVTLMFPKTSPYLWFGIGGISLLAAWVVWNWPITIAWENEKTPSLRIEGKTKLLTNGMKDAVFVIFWSLLILFPVTHFLSIEPSFFNWKLFLFQVGIMFLLYIFRLETTGRSEERREYILNLRVFFGFWGIVFFFLLVLMIVFVSVGWIGVWYKSLLPLPG